jgi:hypothetical protein
MANLHCRSIDPEPAPFAGEGSAVRLCAYSVPVTFPPLFSSTFLPAPLAPFLTAGGRQPVRAGSLLECGGLPPLYGLNASNQLPRRAPHSPVLRVGLGFTPWVPHRAIFRVRFLTFVFDFRLFLRCHPDRRAAQFAARSGGIVARSKPHHNRSAARLSPLPLLPLLPLQ